MNKELYILFTAGRGPVECGLAVKGIQHQFLKALKANKIAYEIVDQRNGPIAYSIETILFKVRTSDRTIIKPWIGSLLWICQSPIRKGHKRKNWYIKGEEICMTDTLAIDMKNVTIQSFRASGPGGQHRNKVETAIRLIHNPTGIIITATDSKSQMQNKKKAEQRLKEKLMNRNKQTSDKNRTVQWNAQLNIERGKPVKIFKGEKFKQ